jgi:Leucine-rich repeat (LRR) protein
MDPYFILKKDALGQYLSEDKESIEINNRGYFQIESGCFQELTKLKRLTITQCKLTKIQEDVFGKWNDGLFTKLFFGNILTNLPELQTIDLSQNTIRNLSDIKILSPGYFNSLVDINLSNNLLTKLDKNSFTNFVNLKTINLSHNLIIQIHALTFNKLKNLEVIDLSHNQIDEIHNESLADLPRLLKINLSYNRIASFNLINVKSLEDVNLEHNNLDKLNSWDFREFNNLKIINLSFNSITRLPSASFKNLANLERIDLSNNKIIEIGEDALVMLPRLSIIDLSNNRVSDVNLSDLSFYRNRDEFVKKTARLFRLVHNGSAVAADRVDSVNEVFASC